MAIARRASLRFGSSGANTKAADGIYRVRGSSRRPGWLPLRSLSCMKSWRAETAHPSRGAMALEPEHSSTLLCHIHDDHEDFVEEMGYFRN